MDPEPPVIIENAMQEKVLKTHERGLCVKCRKAPLKFKLFKALKPVDAIMIHHTAFNS